MTLNKLNNSAGYTLIELLTVITIIGILSTIAIPNYRGYRDKAKVVTVISTLRQIRLMQEVYWTDYQRYFPETVAPIVGATGHLTIPDLDMTIALPHGQTYSIVYLEEANGVKSYTVSITTDMDRNQQNGADKYVYTRTVDSSGNVISETPLLPLEPLAGS